MQIDHGKQRFLCPFYHTVLSDWSQLIDSNGINISLEGL
jgi:hypothetical protein